LILPSFEIDHSAAATCLQNRRQPGDHRCNQRCGKPQSPCRTSGCDETGRPGLLSTIPAHGRPAFRPGRYREAAQISGRVAAVAFQTGSASGFSVRRTPRPPPLHPTGEILRSSLAGGDPPDARARFGRYRHVPLHRPPRSQEHRDGIDILMHSAPSKPKTRIKTALSLPYRLAERGRIMARLPLDPRISRMILEARERGMSAGDRRHRWPAQASRIHGESLPIKKRTESGPCNSRIPAFRFFFPPRSLATLLHPRRIASDPESSAAFLPGPFSLLPEDERMARDP